MTIPLKAILEFLPLVTFFIGYKFFNMKIAIICLLMASAISLAVMRYKKIKIPILMLITYIIMFVFGGLTIYTDDSYFIKIKPSIINFLLGIVLLVDRFLTSKYKLITKLIPVFTSLTKTKLNKLTLIWSAYFIFCALLNELVWRNFDEQTWVYFKVFGLMGINIIFLLVNFLSLRTFLEKNLNVKNFTSK